MDSKTRQIFKNYFEYEHNIAETKKNIASFELEKAYILDTLKAVTLTDMPKAHYIADTSDVISKTDEIDALILSQIMQLQRLHTEYMRVKAIVDMLTEDEKKVLEGRVYNKQIFVISRKVNMCDRQFYHIKARIRDKIGIDI